MERNEQPTIVTQYKATIVGQGKNRYRIDERGDNADEGFRSVIREELIALRKLTGKDCYIEVRSNP